MRLTTCLLLLLQALAPNLAAETTQLSDLRLDGMRIGYGQPQADSDVSGGPLLIGGTTHERGVGTHADSSWTLRLDGKARRLVGHVGVVTFDARGMGSCVFSVRSGDKVLWTSGILRNGDPAKPVDVSLAGLANVTLEVDQADQGNDSDHAAWCCAIEHDGAPLDRLPPRPAPLALRDPGPITDGATLEAAKLGIVPGSHLDAGPALRDLLAKARGAKDVTVVLAPGEYRIGAARAARREWPQSNTDTLPWRRYGVVIEGAEGLTLRAAGAMLRCEGALTALAVVESRRVRIEGLAIDWVRAPISQAEVVSSDGRSAIIRPHPETPLAVRGGKLVVLTGSGDASGSAGGWGGPGIWSAMEWDPATGCPAYQRADLPAPGEAADLGDGTFRVAAAGYKAGNRMLLRHEPRSHAGVLVHRSQGVTMRDCRLHASHGLGCLFQHSKDLTLDATHVVPRPGTGRLYSSKDDGFQFSGCGGRIVVRGCEFAGLFDDPINVHGTYLDITRRVDARTLEAKFAHPQSQNQPWADPGDAVAFANRSNLLRASEAKVVSWKLTSTGTGRLAFDRDLPAAIGTGWVAENLTMSPELEVRGCRFLGARARGLLVTTPGRVVIEDNLFRSAGTAILINGDCNGWFESGAVTDVSIRRNRFEDCLLANYQFCDGIISIIPTNARVEGPVHRNIRVENNTFVVFDAPLLYARATEGLSFSHNRIERVDTHRPWHYRKSALTLEHCRQVTIEGNTAKGEPVSREVRHVESTGVRIAPGDALR